MNYLYGRVISVKIEPPTGDSKTFEHNVEDGKLFRIDFEVSFKGHATISLYNVLDVTARMCEPATVGGKKKFASLTLEAGYNSDVSLLAKGEIIQSVVKRSGADKILEMKLSPKVSLFNDFVIPKEYNGTYRTIIPQILKDNGISYFEILTTEGLDQVVEKFTSTGTLKQVLDKISKTLKSDVSLHLGKLVIATKDGKTFLKNRKVILDKESGLIGSPTRKGKLYIVKSLLQPKIANNQVVHLTFRDFDSKEQNIDKEFVVKDGKHKGSSFENDFYSEFECVAK